MSERPQRVLVLARDWRRFTYWCSIQNPPENPKDRKFVVITPDTLKRGMSRGFHRQEGDRFIRINAAPYDWPGRYEQIGDHDDLQYITAATDLHYALMPGGWNLEEAERVET